MLFTLLLCLFAAARPLGAAESETEALRAAGIRTLRSKHLTLYTDLPSQPDVDDLPSIFDLAVPQWTKFFGIESQQLDSWHVVGCVVQNKARFRDYGLLPETLPPFLHGFQMNDQIWVYEQPGAYYRRHLLLHEGTHAVMNRIFGRVGPAWYREGLAEMLGTHRYEDSKLTLAQFPADKRHVEHWGRIRIVNDEVQAGKIRSIQSIVDARSRDFLNVESYAWSWALQEFGHRHPQFRPTFLQLQDEMHHSTRGVTRHFLGSYHDKKDAFDSAWQLFLQHLDYGFDASAEKIHNTAEPCDLTTKNFSFQLDTTKGWQSTGLRVPTGQTIEIAAQGRFKVAQDTQTWWCEPQGVSIVYYQERPLGMLLATVVPDGSGETQGMSFGSPTGIGRRGKLSANRGGVLYLRINERADRMQDNAGQIKVHVRCTNQPSTSPSTQPASKSAARD